MAAGASTHCLRWLPSVDQGEGSTRIPAAESPGYSTARGAACDGRATLGRLRLRFAVSAAGVWFRRREFATRATEVGGSPPDRAAASCSPRPRARDSVLARVPIERHSGPYLSRLP